MSQDGYYRYPTINKDTIIFTCEDDLWSVSSSGGEAKRLTSNLAEVSKPYISPDGNLVAFTAKEEGNTEIYLMDSNGGIETRLTYLGANSYVVGWAKDSKEIYFASNSAQPFVAINNIYKISINGGLIEKMPVGYAHNISYGPKGEAVLGRFTLDPARWKRYRGGRAGVLWVDPKGDGKFKKLFDIKGNIGNPMWINNTIYFISDHEGIGNLYSCTKEGKSIKKLTNNKDYYVRNATTDGKQIVYHSGSDIFVYDITKDKSKKIDIKLFSPRIQKQRKFSNSSKYLADYNIHPEGHSLLVTTRGKSFAMGNWEGAVNQLGEQNGVRYSFTQWLFDKEKIVTVSDKSGKDALEIHQNDLHAKVTALEKLDIGRVLQMEASPKEDKVVISNHRFELIMIDLKTKKSKVLDKSEHERINGFSWSPDGKWVTYSFAYTSETFAIKICEIKSGKTHDLTSPRFGDIRPSFDPDGKFIYFISYRDFNPVYDSQYFDLNFPRGSHPYLISLQKETKSPFIPEPKPLDKIESDDKDSKKDKKKDSDIKIDFEGIQDRVISFPVPEQRYLQVFGIKGKVLFTYVPVQGALEKMWFPDKPSEACKLKYYDFDEQKLEVVANKVTSFKLSSQSGTLVYRSGNKLRVTKITPIDKNKGNGNNRKDGWINLDRIKVSVNPEQEWEQMYNEIWRLQKEHFWVPNMSHVDWDKIYKRYLPLVKRAGSRAEFSDLIWELQGELGTSHAYEVGGDYRPEPNYKQGFLGASFKYNKKQKGYEVEHIVKGDSWNKNGDSPLNGIGFNINKGDILIGINGQPLDENNPPEKYLVNQAKNFVNLTFSGKKEDKTISVKTLGDESYARYREWVENNRRIVYEKTNGKVGYVHVPDMGAFGYAEFHRYYLAECERDCLIVDVRFNRGGHVSQLLLEKLGRKRIGYDLKRWGQAEAYPSYSVLGKMVALTNENAGSDGDIFSHCFKLMNLGTLVGKRTWGGVIGIHPRHKLVDNSYTTQPEFSFWFVDVGWDVENYGTDPDIEVDIAPQDWANGKDPQLDKGIELMLKELKTGEIKVPDFGPKPNLSLPE